MRAGPKHIQSAALLRLLGLLEHGKYRTAVGATSLTNVVVVIHLNDRLLKVAWDHGWAMLAVIMMVYMMFVDMKRTLHRVNIFLNRARDKNRLPLLLFRLLSFGGVIS